MVPESVGWLQPPPEHAVRVGLAVTSSAPSVFVPEMGIGSQAEMFHPVEVPPLAVIVVVNVEVLSTPLSVTPDEVALPGVETPNAAPATAASAQASRTTARSGSVRLIGRRSRPAGNRHGDRAGEGACEDVGGDRDRD